VTFRGAVISVGGTSEPIVKSLNEGRPGFVLFVVSAGSKPEVEQNVLPRLSYIPQYSCAQVVDETDVAVCYEAARDAIPGWLKDRGLQPEEVYVDITGATKAMSAGLAMAAAERFSHFTYVRGKERNKGGLGVVVSGTEEVFRTLNPWDKLAARERDKATWLFRNAYPEQAERLLQEAAGRCREELRTELSTLAALLALFAEADRFRFKDLYGKHRSIQEKLRLIFSHRNQWDVLQKLDTTAEHWKGLDEERKSEGKMVSATLHELLANALRRASQARYDDAVARLYRAAELFVQGKLQEAFGWRLGKPNLEVSVGLPPENRKSLQGEFAPRLALEQGFRALAYSPRQEDRDISSRHEAIKGHLQKRNESILAHGLRAASEEDFQDFLGALLSVLDVTRQEIPHWPELEF
jgi:CRISPR-associated protein (TIGR02710 family)